MAGPGCHGLCSDSSGSFGVYQRISAKGGKGFAVDGGGPDFGVGAVALRYELIPFPSVFEPCVLKKYFPVGRNG